MKAVAEIPRLAAGVFGCGPKDCSFDCHASVQIVVVAGHEQTFDRHSEQHDAALCAVNVPARHAERRLYVRHRRDFYTHIAHLRPRCAQKLDCGTHDEIEAIKSPLKRRKRRTHHRATTHAAVATMTGGPARCGSRRSGTTAMHVKSLARACDPGRLAAARHPQHTPPAGLC